MKRPDLYIQYMCVFMCFHFAVLSISKLSLSTAVFVCSYFCIINIPLCGVVISLMRVLVICTTPPWPHTPNGGRTILFYAGNKKDCYVE